MIKAVIRPRPLSERHTLQEYGVPKPNWKQGPLSKEHDMFITVPVSQSPALYIFNEKTIKIISCQFCWQAMSIISGCLGTI